MKINKNNGFTLIELMITVAIVGILSAVAMPAYQDYTVRSQVSEGLLLAEGAKGNVIEAVGQTGTLAGIDSALAGFSSTSGKYVTGVTINNGVIIATFGNSSSAVIAGGTILLSPTLTGTNITWACTGAGINNKYLPNSCK